MNIDRSTARPPRWAEALLRAILHAKDRDSVSGDLLEEFRETIVPQLGRGAGRWYVLQVGPFLVRATWTWGAVLGCSLVIRYWFDTRMPPADYTMRAATLSYIVIGTCAAAGFGAAWRTRSILGGVITSIGGAALGSVASIVGTAAMLAIWHDPATLQAWNSSGGLQEAFVDVPLKIMAMGAIVGLAGALGAKALSIGRSSPEALKRC